MARPSFFEHRKFKKLARRLKSRALAAGSMELLWNTANVNGDPYLPTVEDVIEGVVASKIAAHAADLALGMHYAVERDNAMATARKELNWNKQVELSFNPENAKALRDSSEIGKDDVCTMCGEFCAIKRIKGLGE